MKMRVLLLDCVKARTATGIVTIENNVPTLTVDGAPRDSGLYDLAESWLGVVTRAFEAGVSDERAGNVGVGVKHGP